MARLLGVRDNQIPHLYKTCEKWNRDEQGTLVKLTRIWLEPLGYTIRELKPSSYPGIPHIRYGLSAVHRNEYHAVVYQGRFLIYDPEKSARGLRTEDAVYKIIQTKRYRLKECRENRKRLRGS